VRIITYIMLSATLFSGQGFSQKDNLYDAVQDKNSFASNECIAKGGVGIIDKNLYVDLKSAKNELILGGGKRWTGQGAPNPEVVIFFESRIWSPPSLPEGFDLSKAVIVSFEGNKVRFFDFGKVSGGYYRRGGQNESQKTGAQDQHIHASFVRLGDSDAVLS
jgi:hypothetical protein